MLWGWMLSIRGPGTPASCKYQRGGKMLWGKGTKEQNKAVQSKPRLSSMVLHKAFAKLFALFAGSQSSTTWGTFRRCQQDMGLQHCSHSRIKYSPLGLLHVYSSLNLLTVHSSGIFRNPRLKAVAWQDACSQLCPSDGRGR